jgi:hypothetical protein
MRAKSSRVNDETPSVSGLGPAKTMRINSVYSCGSSRGGRPSPQQSESPSRPCAL